MRGWPWVVPSALVGLFCVACGADEPLSAESVVANSVEPRVTVQVSPPDLTTDTRATLPIVALNDQRAELPPHVQAQWIGRISLVTWPAGESVGTTTSYVPVPAARRIALHQFFVVPNEELREGWYAVVLRDVPAGHTVTTSAQHEGPTAIVSRFRVDSHPVVVSAGMSPSATGSTLIISTSERLLIPEGGVDVRFDGESAYCEFVSNPVADADEESMRPRGPEAVAVLSTSTDVPLNCPHGPAGVIELDLPMLTTLDGEILRGPDDLPGSHLVLAFEGREAGSGAILDLRGAYVVD